MKLFFGVVFFAGIACLAIPGRGQVNFFGVQKSEFYDQTSDSAPLSPTNYSVYAFANTDSSSDADSFTMTDDGTSVTMPLTTSPGGTSYSGSTYYPDSTTLDAAYPSGDNYVFQAVGGNLAGETDQLPVPADNYAPFVYLTGTSYDAAQDASPNSDLILTLAYSTAGGTAAINSEQFSIYSQTGATILTSGLTPNATTLNITQADLDELTPGVPYTVALTDFNTTSYTTTGDFSSANNSDGFTTTTDFGLTVESVPEPSSFVLLALAGFGLALFRAGRCARP